MLYLKTYSKVQHFRVCMELKSVWFLPLIGIIHHQLTTKYNILYYNIKIQCNFCQTYHLLNRMSRLCVIYKKIPMHQMIMALQNKEGDTFFVSIDNAWDNNGYSLVWPSIFDEETHKVSSCLSSFLHQHHGDVVFKLLSVEEQ